MCMFQIILLPEPGEQDHEMADTHLPGELSRHFSTELDSLEPERGNIAKRSGTAAAYGKSCKI